jgi:hypothetical protein
MATIAEIEELALQLPEEERSILVDRIIRTLPAQVDDDDEEDYYVDDEEVARRGAEMISDPSSRISHEEFIKAIGWRSAS